MEHRRVFEALAAICIAADPTPALPQSLQCVGHQIGLFQSPADEFRWRTGLPEKPLIAAILRLGGQLSDLGRLKLAETQVAGMLEGFAGRVHSELSSAPGEAGAVDVAGFHPDRFMALAACVGEAAEYLSQLPRPGDIKNTESDGAAIVTGIDYVDGSPVKVPARQCLILPDGDPTDPHRLSSGCATGPRIETAVESAVLELIERDAVVGWWLGFRPSRRLVSKAKVISDLFSFERALRGPGGSEREMALYDIRQEINLPVVAAVSFLPDGTGFAAGYAARRSLSEAGRRAICEMLQMEFGQASVVHKSEALGLEALDQSELRQLLRARHVTPSEVADRCAAKPSTFATMADYNGTVHAAISPECCTRPPKVSVVNLTRRSVGLPVAKALSNEMRKLPVDPIVAISDVKRRPGFPIPLF